MDDFLDAEIPDQAKDDFAVADIGDNEALCIRRKPARAVREVVERDRRLIRLIKGEQHMRADIAGAAGDEDGHRRLPPASLAGSIVGGRQISIEGSLRLGANIG